MPLLIDTKSVAEAALEAFRELLRDEPYARQSLDSDDLPQALLEHLLREMYLVSLMTEETRPCRPAVVLTPRASGYPMLRWTTPLLARASDIRRAAFMVPERGALALDLSTPPSLIGIVGDVHAHAPLRPRVVASGTGAVEVHAAGRVLVALSGSDLLVRRRSFLPQLAPGFANEAAALFGSDTNHVALKHVFDGLLAQRTTGSVWIVPRGADVGRLRLGFQFAPQRWREQTRDQQEIFARLDWIHALTQIDGAVLVDPQMEVLGAGVFANITDGSQMVHRVKANGDLEKIPRDDVGGGRHRSAISFCVEMGQAYAIVMSSDGRYTAISSANASTLPVVCEFGPTEPAENHRHYHIARGERGPAGTP